MDKSNPDTEVMAVGREVVEFAVSKSLWIFTVDVLVQSAVHNMVI